ncbi:MAG: HAD family hydrolase [Syntrophales bacterium]
MNATSSGKLIIFDYSGTLSLEAPRFARPESLMRALAESGLAGVGVTNTEIFWEGIITPTWIEGSTTSAGYKRVMAERIAALRLAPGTSAGEIEAAASRFVESYLDHSRIDTRWRPLLERLRQHPKIGVVIATDHYAEATGKIIDNLSAWKIPAENICSSLPPRDRAADTGILPGDGMRTELPCHHPFFVANSADIGTWKEESRFWKIVKDERFPERIAKLLIIDDFGFNEETDDRYGGEPAKIARRQERTRESLLKAFQVKAEIVPFFCEGERRHDDGAFTQLITETALHIDRFLE